MLRLESINSKSLIALEILWMNQLHSSKDAWTAESLQDSSSSPKSILGTLGTEILIEY